MESIKDEVLNIMNATLLPKIELILLDLAEKINHEEMMEFLDEILADPKKEEA